MWESSIYKLRQPLGQDEDGNNLYRQIVVDVTGSVPPHAETGAKLSATIDQAIKLAGVRKTDTVLDFGAGKLRNTRYLLGWGYRVHAVEFKGLFGRSKPAAENLAWARRFRVRFKSLSYPHQFEATDYTYKLVLLINVVNVMPVPAERLLVLQQCHEKLDPGGCLLWYTQRRRDQAYKKRMVPEFRVGDGWYIQRGKKLKTFYREYKVPEIDDMLSAAGFEFFTSDFDEYANNQVRLYRRLDGAAPLAGAITPGMIDHARVVDPSIPDPAQVLPVETAVPEVIKKGDPDPELFQRARLLAGAFSRKKRGDDHATDYEEHIRGVFSHLFSDQFTNLTFRESGYTPFRDIVATRGSREGFFKSLFTDYEIPSSKILIECRNNAIERVRKRDLIELGSGLGTGMGKAGILAFRGGDHTKAMRRCQDVWRYQRKAIIPLNDGDFQNFLQWKSEGGDSRIQRHLKDRLAEVRRPYKVFISYSHKDEKYLVRFKTHLSTTDCPEEVDVGVWDDTMLKPGQQWRRQIRAAVDYVEIAVLFVSADFLASPFIQKNELGPFREAAEKGTVILLPVMVGRTHLPKWLREIEFVNDTEKPLEAMRRKADRDAVFVKLLQEILDRVCPE